MKKKIGTRWNWPSIAFDVTAFGLCYRLLVESMTVVESLYPLYSGPDALAMFLRVAAALVFYAMTIMLMQRTGSWRR